MVETSLIVVGIIFIVICIYILATEYASQNCLDRHCLNTTPHANSNDTPKEIIDKLIATIRTNHSPVEWRKSLFIGIVVAFLVLYFCNLKWNLKNFVIIMFIVFFFVYATLTYITWAYYLPLETCLESNLTTLRPRV